MPEKIKISNLIMDVTEISDIKEIIAFASKIFNKNFNSNPTFYSSAPARVNLIGEHTDYNDGFVLPMALPLVTVIVGRQNDLNSARIVTTSEDVDDPKSIEFLIPSDNTHYLTPGKPHWANYVKGVIANFKGHLSGFDAVIATSVPVGGGLSSSAALEVATYLFLEALSGETIISSLVEKALLCQKAEHHFPGTPCGIMDQFISFMGKKDHALLLDCRTLEFQLIKMKNPEIAVLITNTNVHHNLAESQYSKRRQQCEIATKIIGKSSLRDITIDELEGHKEELGIEIYYRCLHVIKEIQRTLEAAKALEEENYNEFGILMQQSHHSLRDYYEVSCPELDEVVQAALEVNGVYGARMTGGGFGGCTVTLLQNDAIQDVIQNIKVKYKGRPTFYVCRPSDGAKMIMWP